MARTHLRLGWKSLQHPYNGGAHDGGVYELTPGFRGWTETVS
ncbi:MAG: hypothetical protein WAL56_14925 [Candidatus Sulfotelmatobacter sp.]